MSNKFKPVQAVKAQKHITDTIANLVSMRLRVISTDEMKLGLPSLVVGIPMDPLNPKQIKQVPAILEVCLWNDEKDQSEWIAVPFVLSEMAAANQSRIIQ